LVPDLFLRLADNTCGDEGAYFTYAIQTRVKKLRIPFFFSEGISKAQGGSFNHGIGDSGRTAQDGTQAQA
jgi:hypothetical protein